MHHHAHHPSPDLTTFLLFSILLQQYANAPPRPPRPPMTWAERFVTAMIMPIGLLLLAIFEPHFGYLALLWAAIAWPIGALILLGRGLRHLGLGRLLAPAMFKFAQLPAWPVHFILLAPIVLYAAVLLLVRIVLVLGL